MTEACCDAFENAETKLKFTSFMMETPIRFCPWCGHDHNDPPPPTRADAAPIRRAPYVVGRGTVPRPVSSHNESIGHAKDEHGAYILPGGGVDPYHRHPQPDLDQKPKKGA